MKRAAGLAGSRKFLIRLTSDRERMGLDFPAWAHSL